MGTVGAHATVLNVQMMLRSAYVIGTSWNTLLVQAVMLLVLEVACVAVIPVTVLLAKMDSLIVIYAMIDNVQNVQTTLLISA